MSINLNDGTWLSYPEAMAEFRKGRRQLQYLAAKHPEIRIKIGGTVYFHLHRTYAALCPNPPTYSPAQDAET
jgi:hypothetical protein